jgi:Cu/Ag efflux protein CusF
VKGRIHLESQKNVAQRQHTIPIFLIFILVKDLFIILIFCGIIASAFGQMSTDSLGQKFASASQNFNVDSFSQKILPSPDTLLPSFQKIDSIRNGFNLAADSLQTKYQKTISEIGAQTRRITLTIDSLQRLNLPASKHTKALDSLKALYSSTVSKLTSKLDSLKSKTIDKLSALDLPPEYKEPLQEVTNKINQIDLNAGKINLPELKIPGYSLPKMDGLGNLTDKAGDVANIDPGNLPDIKTSVGDLSNVSEQVQGYQREVNNLTPDGLGQVTGQVQTYQEDIKNINQGNLRDVEKLPEGLESQATKIDGMDELQKQSAIMDEYKAQLDKLAESNKAKEKAVEVAKKAAVNHFAGEQEQLKAAMEKVSKYKQKYSSVSSIRDLPKRPPNPMKGKPFIERLVPGLYFQYQQKNAYLVDVNPYVGYKISGRFTSGLGWNHRLAYDKKYHTWDDRSRIFGPRAYVDFKVGRGFIAHLEGECMNTFVPSTLLGNPDAGQREWVWSTMTGIKKEYKIYKNLKGTALIQYNLFNRYYKAPYVDRLNSRIGFEYVLKKKVKK